MVACQLGYHHRATSVVLTSHVWLLLLLFAPFPLLLLLQAPQLLRELLEREVGEHISHLEKRRKEMVSGLKHVRLRCRASVLCAVLC